MNKHWSKNFSINQGIWVAWRNKQATNLILFISIHLLTNSSLGLVTCRLLSEQVIRINNHVAFFIVTAVGFHVGI